MSVDERIARVDADLLDLINAGFEALTADAIAWREELAERAWWDPASKGTDS